MRLAQVAPMVGLALGLAGCAPRPTPHPASASSAPSRPTAEAPSRPAVHNWLYRKGQEYAYQQDPSAVPHKAGSQAPAVQMYRFLGERDGVYTLQVDGETATCANPCQVITLQAGGFHRERLAFDPDSLIGAAFTDAFNGRMAVYDPANGERRAR
jgi:hypothetical protein